MVLYVVIGAADRTPTEREKKRRNNEGRNGKETER